jgi:hypothetical protein
MEGPVDNQDANFSGRKFWATIVVGFFSGILTLALPHEREVSSLLEFVLKLIPFICGVEAIAQFNPRWLSQRWLAPVLVPLTFLIYFGYFVPRNFYWGGVRVEDPDAFGSLYYNILLLTPFIILSLCLAYRLGGGAKTTVRRLGIGMLLVMVSGIEDLAFLTVNDLSGTPFSPIPDVWTWPSHMKVRIGHWPSKNEAFAFIALHLLAAGFVLWAPGRWFARIRGAMPVGRTPTMSGR